ncbi:hypothetical protein ACJMK2_022522 [Sinanodonta woodiana]|uniref:Uncharacterized protein n=1 Tax=Sinanodonta woodiana TaxID=1069815 RepID=A0ABD3TJB6_SINWO
MYKCKNTREYISEHFGLFQMFLFLVLDITFLCVADGYMCLKTDQCCGKKSICVVKKEPNQENTVSSSLGICMNIYKYPKGVVGQKEEGERCDTSYECASGCCRYVQRHRYGSMQLCGEPGHYTCIFKEYSSNDIDNNY